MEKYNYVMRYVPMREDLSELKKTDVTKILSSSKGEESYPESVINAAMSAIESMLSMCAMVYMKCMEKLTDEI